MDQVFSHFSRCFVGKAVAVAVSGGPDSVALAHALIEHCKKLYESGKLSKVPVVNVLSVNHGLRDQAEAEIDAVSNWLQPYGSAVHHVKLYRNTDDVGENKIQESARNDRYKLMAESCKEHDISYLFLGHHLDDQAETVLFRLASGSGPDGMAGMAPFQEYNSNLTLCRPLLRLTKHELVSYCNEHNLAYTQDPSNEDDQFARVRLRKAREVLDLEGLTSERLSRLSQRLSRSRDALNAYTEECFDRVYIEGGAHSGRFVFDYGAYMLLPHEIAIRIMRNAIKLVSTTDESKDKRSYDPPLGKVEALFFRLVSEKDFKKASLAHCFVVLDSKKGRLIIER